MECKNVGGSMLVSDNNGKEFFMAVRSSNVGDQ